MKFTSAVAPIQIGRKAIVRDKVLLSVLFVALGAYCLIPTISLFSMRQVQALSITLSLSATSLILLVLATMLGSFSIWRDVERRYTAAVLGLPISRCRYLLSRFVTVALALMVCSLILALVSGVVILLTSTLHPGEAPVAWAAVAVAVAMDCCKYILLAGFALLFSAVSSSFFLPVFGTLAIYVVGSASQEVMEYLTASFGRDVSPIIKTMAQILYYLLPNFSAFNYKVQAIYALPPDWSGLALTFFYFLVYLTIVLGASVWIFSRRELN